MRTRIFRTALGLVVASLVTPALGQTPAQEVSAAMQRALAAQVLEGCDQALTDVGE